MSLRPSSEPLETADGSLARIPRPQIWLLALATIWALAWEGVAFLYHINEPAGVTSITTNGHTYVGHPPALTLNESDPFSTKLAVAIVAVVLGVCFLEAALFGRRRPARRATLTTTLGCLLLAYSAFGLSWGILSIGVVGLLMLLSASPAWSRRNA